MYIKYLGEYTTEKRSYGCSRCGTGSSYNGVESYKTRDRHYYNGRLIVFNQGEMVQVDEVLGNYLLRKQYRDRSGYMRYAYERVKPDHKEEWAEGYSIGELEEQPKLTPREIELIERDRRERNRRKDQPEDAVERTLRTNSGVVKVDKGDAEPPVTANEVEATQT